MTFERIIYYLKKSIFTLLGLVLALYFFVILLTYTANDPSWSHISSDMVAVNNMGGVMGAWLSDFLYSFLGVSAWLFFIFLLYETLLIWWSHSSISWSLRLISYLFLLLSSCTLLVQLVILIENIIDKQIAPVGGIIGQGLSWRLDSLLTPSGAFLFILALTTVTTTFAFDIHWIRLVKRITGQASFNDADFNDSRIELEKANYGDMIDDKDDKPQAIKASQKIDDETTQDKPMNELVDDVDNELQAVHEQLPLDLPLQEYEVGKNKKPYELLNEFLHKTGISKTIKQDIEAKNIAQEQIRKDAEKKAQREKQQKAQQQMDREKPVAESRAVENSAQSSVVQENEKIEPSFAWNDLQAIDELLNTDEIIQNHANQTSQVESHHYIDDENIHDASKHDIKNTKNISQDKNKVLQDDENYPDKRNTQYQNVYQSPSKQPYVNENSQLQDHNVSMGYWHDDLSQNNDVQDSYLQNDYSQNANLQNNPLKDDYEVIVEEVPYDEPMYDQSFQEATSSYHRNHIEQTSMDMTPTNTPPVNPKEPPTIENEYSKTQEKVAKPYYVSMPHVHQSQDDHEQDVVQPNKSRAMQTAKYRKSLTPIPPLSLLDRPDPNRKPVYSRRELQELSELLEIKLQEFNVKAEVKHAILGPVVTRFEVELAAGVKASKVTGIARDLARSLSMPSLRVVEIIAGKPYIGIEVPNTEREMVYLIELLDTKEYRDPDAQVSMAMGKDIGGKPIITDLAKAPHMLVAGTTGSGKSILVNAMLLSMLLKYTPDELRLILIDPKQLELANYNDIPHLLTPVVTDMTEAASSLSWCVAEMERRYQLMSLLKVRKVSEFNKKVLNAEQAGEPLIDPLWRPNDSVSIDKAPKLKTLPLIVIVADEFADMIMQVGKQAEELITRLAQKSRAAGIHLMLATQRPSVDVITGLIKANIPMRAALRVNSKVDSRTILDSGGAEDMLGNGDMLFIGPGQIEPERIHGAYVSDGEVNRVCDAWRERGSPDYIDNMASNFALTAPDGGDDDNSDLYDRAVAFILETRKPSASSLQRKFSIGYNKAARLIDEMESAGLVSPMDKSGRRELLV